MDRLRSARNPAAVPVDCCVRGLTECALAYDIAVSGCMLDTSDGYLEAGDPLLMRFEDHSCRMGRVVWRKGRSACVAFTTPIHRPTRADVG
jgi:hypothetical protein